MKPRLIVICGILYPNPSPTGQCALRYAMLLREYYEIEFISISTNGYSEEVFFNDFRVHTLSSIRLSIEKRTKGIVSKTFHAIGSLQLKIYLTGNLHWYRKAIKEKLEQIYKKAPIDAILSVCSPFQAHQAGADFKSKHPNVRFCAYTVDPFATKNRIVPLGRNYSDFIALERSVCEATDCLFLSEEALTARQDIYGKVLNVMPLPYLLPEPILGGKYFFDNNSINCVYAGSFYRDLRNPDYMLKVFSGLKSKNIILHLFSSGCEEIVNSYLMHNDNIVSHGYVSQEKLRDVYSSCDFLVGIGNASHEFLPSKTYEYLSLRRPIIFLNPKGFHNEVLDKYPHAIQISDDTPIGNALKELEGFVISKRGTSITESELYQIYNKNTPSYISSILMKGLRNKNK